MRTPVFQLFCSTAIIAIVHAAWASASPFRGDDGLVVSPKAATRDIVRRAKSDCHTQCHKPWSAAFGNVAAKIWCESNDACPKGSLNYSKANIEPYMPSTEDLLTLKNSPTNPPANFQLVYDMMNWVCDWGCAKVWQPWFHGANSHPGCTTQGIDSVNMAKFFCADSYCKDGRPTYEGPEGPIHHY